MEDALLSVGFVFTVYTIVLLLVRAKLIKGMKLNKERLFKVATKL